MFPLELSILPSILFPVSWSVVDLCANHYLLQTGASHIKDERVHGGGTPKSSGKEK